MSTILQSIIDTGLAAFVLVVYAVTALAPFVLMGAGVLYIFG